MPGILGLIALIFISLQAIAAGPVWDKRNLDNAYERHRDWLVVNDPSGFCYMLQSYGSAVPDLIVRNDDSINLMNAGRYQSITYQVDVGDKFTIHNPGISGTGYVLLPDASIQILKPGSSLCVVINHAKGETRVSYSLMGFTRAHNALIRCRQSQ